MVCLRYHIFGNIFHQLLLTIQRTSCFGCQTDTFRNTKNMRIYRHRGLIPPYSQYHIGSFPSYSSQGLQLFAAIRYIASIHIYHSFRHLHQVLCFAIRVAYRTDIFQHIFCVRFGQICNSRVCCK